MKLEDFDKKNIFETPEGYFEKLPLQIQKRVASKPASPKLIWQPIALRVGIPSIATLAIALFLWVQYSPAPENEVLPITSPEEFLAEVSQEEVENYLLTSDILHSELAEAALEGNLDSYEISEDALNTTTIEEEILELDIDLIDVQTYL